MLPESTLQLSDPNSIGSERAVAEEAATLREDDFQLSYAIDLLKGLSKIQTGN